MNPDFVAKRKGYSVDKNDIIVKVPETADLAALEAELKEALQELESSMFEKKKADTEKVEAERDLTMAQETAEAEEGVMYPNLDQDPRVQDAIRQQQMIEEWEPIYEFPNIQKGELYHYANRITGETMPEENYKDFKKREPKRVKALLEDAKVAAKLTVDAQRVKKPKARREAARVLKEKESARAAKEKSIEEMLNLMNLKKKRANITIESLELKVEEKMAEVARAKYIVAQRFGVTEWGDDKVGGKGYGVVVRIITELTPEGQETAVYKAGVKSQMAAVRIMVDGEVFEVQTEEELLLKFKAGAEITFKPKPDLPVGTSTTVPGVGGATGQLVTFQPIGDTVPSREEVGHKYRKNIKVGEDGGVRARICALGHS